MSKVALLLTTFIFFFSCKKEQGDNSLLDVGIPLDMALYRKQQVSDVVYHLGFDIPLLRSEPIPAKMTLELQIHDLEHSLYLDFNEDSEHIKKVTVNNEEIPVRHEMEHLIIGSKYLNIGANLVNVSFEAGELSLNRNDDYLYTLLVPDRASTLFPCFDQPNIKARYVLNITAPKSWEVLCGAPLKSKEEIGGNIHYNFRPSDLMSTYLFSFVAGEFKTIQKEMDGLTMTMLYRENDEEKLAASIDEIFKLHSGALRFMEDYTHYKFPFQKFDFATIPGFQYGGMEHTGAIQYRESTLFLDDNATQSQKLSRAKLIAHETAHMWFGNLVTMEWFDDVWLKEVFANFMADKIAEELFPEVNHQLNFMREHYASAYSEDRTQGATPIKQQLDNLKNAGTLYGRIIYNKAPIMMRQLEVLVGKDVFRKGMQEYIKSFANSNADWSDLIAILDGKSDADIKKWSEIWVNKPSRPIISDHIIFQDGVIKQASLSQKAEDGSNHIWPQSFDVGLIYEDAVQVVPIQLREIEQGLDDLKGLPKPKSIIYNYNGLGYGVFPMDNLEVNTVAQLQDDVARGYTYINLYENVLTGRFNPNEAFDVFLKALSLEMEELILTSISGYASSIFWNYLSDSERKERLVNFEHVLKERLLHQNDTKSIKKTLFNTFENMAYSKEGVAFLYGIWNKEIEVPNLKLNEDDYTSLAFSLALYGHNDSEEILGKAIEDISNPDRKKRAQFLRPSLSKDKSVRDGFMETLKEADNREKESWVISALYNIHHPLRQDSAIKHLRMNLELMEEIQKTGDIFFPKNWASATIGNYSSQEAYQILESFLEGNPNFPLVLKNKVLQAADKIYRAKYIREKSQ